MKQIGKYLIMLDHLLGEGHYGKVYLTYKYSEDQPGYVDMNCPMACKVLE
jgi:hypothetical protein